MILRWDRGEEYELKSFDGIIVGAGHNALVLQAYLSRCGLRTLSIDQSLRPGGGLNTIENPRIPGCRHNLHSFFHRGLTGMPWWTDLNLAANGVEYIEPDLNVAMVTSDGRVLQWWRDFDRTVESFATFSKKDADRLRYWYQCFRPIVEKILIPEGQSPPIDPTLRRTLLEKCAIGRRLLEVSALSPLEFVTREFEHESVRAGLLFFNGLREVDLRLEGFGHSIPSLIASSGKAQMCVGGSYRLAEGLVRVIESHGGIVRCGERPRQIIVRGDSAVGVELESGERIGTDGFVVSGLNPQQTFVDLLSDHDGFSGVKKLSSRFQYNLIAPLIGLHLVLRKPPEYHAVKNCPELRKAFMVILGLDRFEQFSDLVAGHEARELRSPIAWGAAPTIFDSSQATGQRHTAFLWEKVPYEIGGDSENWIRFGERRGKELLSLWQKSTANLTEDNILDQFVVTPRDTVQALPNMQGSDLLVGAFSSGQVGRNRPFYEAGQYRTPVKGLYLCGGSTHPGGNVMGLAGYNAASVIAEDFHFDRWWQSTDFTSVLRSLT